MFVQHEFPEYDNGRPIEIEVLHRERMLIFLREILLCVVRAGMFTADDAKSLVVCYKSD